VAVFERREVLGGAAVTEEIVNGFKFSRGSYLLSLLRPVVVKELQLKKYGLKFYIRDPNSYTPVRDSKDYLLLGRDKFKNRQEIAKFSSKDAEVFAKYEEWLERLAKGLDPLLDNVPINMPDMYAASRRDRWSTIRPIMAFGKMLSTLKTDLPSFYELILSPASKILERWFESDVLIGTLATDSVIGSVLSPYSIGSGYVLLHHVMGELDGQRNAWAYAEGGMGSVSGCIARSGLAHGAHLFTDKPVKEILVDGGAVKGVALEGGEIVESELVLSSATPKVTFQDLLPQGTLPDSFQELIDSVDYSSAVTKINVALKGLPQFIASPDGYPTGSLEPGPHHQCTIHMNSESLNVLHEGYVDLQHGRWSKRPLIELCMASSLDPTLAPPGCHVASIFTQYSPYSPVGCTHANGKWTDEAKLEYTNLIFDTIEGYAPGFRQLIVGWETLTPPDLEEIFGLTGGNIFHGSMSLDQLYMSRPTYSNPSYKTPLDGLILCGSGSHPGGGVMGAPGRLAAQIALKRF
jgi:phytoene dehydrogenase-like protein